jgi:hypothetical protein
MLHGASIEQHLPALTGASCPACGPPGHAPRPPAWRVEELAAPAVRVRLLLLRGRLACADDALRGSVGHRAERARNADRMAGGGHQPGGRDDFRAVGCAGACRVALAAVDDHAAWLAGARADLQGPAGEAQGTRPGHLRLSRLSAAAERGHPDVSGGPCAGRRGPGRACRDHARDRPPLQSPLRPRAGFRAAGQRAVRHLGGKQSRLYLDFARVTRSAATRRRSSPGARSSRIIRA